MANAILQTDTNIPSLSGKTTDQKIDTIMNYLFMLREQLTYTLNNIDSTNFNETGLREITEPITIGISEKIEDLDGRVTTNTTNIAINAQGLTTKVSKASVISEINQSAEAISISASKVNLEGYCTFTDLSTEGSTSINGANIQTGTISADSITANTITLNKLSSEVTNSFGEDNPDYCKSSYIGYTTLGQYKILSPKLIGGTLWATGEGNSSGTTAAVYVTDGTNGTTGTNMEPNSPKGWLSYYNYTDASYPRDNCEYVEVRSYDCPLLLRSTDDYGRMSIVADVISTRITESDLYADTTTIKGRIAMYDGLTYGTLAQRNALSNPSEGQIFFVIS